MKLPLHIRFLNIPRSDRIEAEIRERARQLDAFCEHVMHCEVTVSTVGKHDAQGRKYEVHVDLTLVRTEIVINRVQRHEDVYVVISDAFDAVASKLQDFIRESGEAKAHHVPMQGRVTRIFEEGYGFIETPDGNELYFHRDNLAYPEFDKLKVGMEVRFLQQVGGEGLQAKRVTAGTHPPQGTQ